jgi:hypothetical protein
VTNPERPWNRDPMWNPDLASEAIHEEKLTFTGGGRLRPEGGQFEISLSVGQVGLELTREGGRLFPASRFASMGVKLLTFGDFKEIRFDWPDVQRVERMRGWMPWDRGVRFILRDGRRFVFFSLAGNNLQTILSYAEARGAKVDKKQRLMPS